MKLIITQAIHLILSILSTIITAHFFNVSKANLGILLALAVLVGFFVDIDHLIDYWLFSNFNLNIKKFLRMDYFEKSQKAYIVFHGWEYILLLFLAGIRLSNNITGAWLALPLSYSLHLIWDQIHNHPQHPLGYSILFRLFNNFPFNIIRCKNHNKCK